MKKIKVILIFILINHICIYNITAGTNFSISESTVVDEKNESLNEKNISNKTRVFGWNLFQGNFKNIKKPGYNPDYRIDIGDIINIKLWGAFEHAQDMPVDNQGNIFIPKVGNVNVLGVVNSQLVKLIRKKIRTLYRDKVYVYANVANYQPISVFVAGNVNKPGLYEGMSSDSIIQFLDKAKGINPEYGSYRKVNIIRKNKIIKTIDLYSFLTNGRLDLFQFQNGDVISVTNVIHRITVTGDVKRPYMFELTENKISLSKILNIAILNPTATNVTITRWGKNNKKMLKSTTIKKSGSLSVFSGESINVFQDHSTNLNTITISGEHDGLHTILVRKDDTLGKILNRINFNSRSDIHSIQLFRESVAEKQKQLLLANLKELERQILTTPSVTKEESLMRTQESKSILTFIERAKKVEPKGQIVINKKTDLDEIFLEDNDTIYIPGKTNIVLVQGEVSFPGAHTYAKNLTIEDYIKYAGDLNERADEDKILIIHHNGRVEKCDDISDTKVINGDSILILPKYEGKGLQITKDITQILFQIAVTSGILLAL
ncbi:MAG: polysaccharide export protein [Desulfobacterales bacterium]|nr:polysaccharide export protein [Desulfobacterales bacterium]